MEDARRAAGQRRGVAPGRHALPRRLDTDEPHAWLADEPAEETDGVRAAADAGDGQVGQAPLDGVELGGGIVADAPLEVAHETRIGMRADGRAEDVVVSDVMSFRRPSFIERVRQWLGL